MEEWFEDNLGEEYDYSFKEYEITSTPNDFNIKTIFDFIQSGVVKIPAFQRNYVWDIRRASKLIESIIIGLPIPQIFLYEESKNSFLVIDGQQRLMSIYYFMKGKFPRKERRIELREIFDREGKIPDEILHNKKYFTDFNLSLPESVPDSPNKLNKLNYFTLSEFKTTFELRTIRNVIIKQNMPKDDNSAMFEIFNRLNSGGINLSAQEIRTSLYHSNFYKMLYRVNLNENWRKLINRSEPDLRLKDIEMILRSFAMLLNSKNYKPSMTKFLNSFSNQAKKFSEENIKYFEDLFLSFVNATSKIDPDIFLSKNKKLNISILESVFYAMCYDALENKSLDIFIPNRDKIKILKENEKFIEATQTSTASKKNVDLRLKLAVEILRN